MLIQTLIALVAIALTTLSFIHFYWAAGGTWAIEYTIPDRFKKTFFDEGNKFKTSLATIVVAFGLLGFALVILSNQFYSDRFIPIQWTILLTQIIGALFLFRAIGDFNIFGIFKKKRDSKFAKKDTQIFIPLCLFIGGISLLIGFIS